MKTAIKPKDFDFKTSLYSLRRVYWHNVFVICKHKQRYWPEAESHRIYVSALEETNKWILKQIKGVQQQLNP